MYVSQPSAHAAPTLDERPGGSKCASRDIARKLHLGPPICALRDISQLVASHESTRPRGDTGALVLPEVAWRIIHFLPKLTI